jgi:hypothetical protein
VHFTGFIIRIYHDAQSSEGQNENLIFHIMHRHVYIVFQNFVHVDPVV